MLHCAMAVMKAPYQRNPSILEQSMPSLHHRRIAINNIRLAMLLLLLTTRCHGLQSFRPSKIIGRTSHHHHDISIRSVTSSSLCQGISPVATALPLLRNDCNNISPSFHLCGGRRISKSPYYRASLIKLYSQTNNSSPRNKDDDKDAISTRETEKAATSSFLKQHLAQLEYDGKLQSEEVSSIKDSLLNLLHEEHETTTTAAAFQNRNQINNHMTSSVSNITHIIQTSIELFLTQKKSRQRLHTRPIENAGGYVRTIVRNQLSKKMMSGGGTGGNVMYRLDEVKEQQHQGNQFVDDAIRHQQQQRQEESKQAKQQAQQNNSTKDNTNIQTILQPFHHSNQINPNELNDSCLQILNQTSPNMVQYALEAYVHQKERRLIMKDNMTPILDPSSYVLKILRNAPRDVIASKQNHPFSMGRGDASPAVTASTSQQHQPLTSRDNAPQDFTESIAISPKPPSTPSPDATIPKSSSGVTLNHVDKTLHYLQKLNQPIHTIKGVGPKTEAAFHKLGLFTLRDLLWHFPRAFIDRSVMQSDIRNVREGEIGTVRLTVGKEDGAVKGTTITCMDESGNTVHVTFFKGKSRRGVIAATNEVKRIYNYHSIIVSGKVQHSRKSSSMINPDKCVSADQVESVLGIEPVYALSSGLRKSVLLGAIDNALQVATELLDCVPESLSDETLELLSWPRLADALRIAHKPSSMAEVGPNSPARERLAFEELCMQQAQLSLMRWNLKYKNVNFNKQHHPTCWNDSPLVASAVEALPFQLTKSQQDCLSEMWNDAIVDSNSRMVRLLQGEVGSGKTVLAYLLALGCIETRQGGGRVAAILAPTQLLAHQHAASISAFVSALKDRRDDSSHIRDIQVEILTGGVTGKRREELLQRLEAATADDAVILIGTHALVTDDIVDRLQQLPSVSASSSKGLALSVVDEEQRFGVLQREALSSCAANALYMSATPIPRTFRLKGRSGLMDYTQLVAEKSLTVQTTVAPAEEMDRVISALQNKINSGSKCFWVLPRIGDSKSDDSVSQQASVESRYRALVDFFGENKVGYVHGKMNISDREEQLAAFADEMSDMVILVGTTVIEVGIDIPNVNLLIVEQAERFGLSQLHQLRGRIGRNGSRDALDCHCLLLTDSTKIDDSSPLTRLDILRETTDGADIAEADLLLRGEGDMLGFVQSGIKTGHAVDPTHHWEMISAASLLGKSFLRHFDPPKLDDEGIDDESTGGKRNTNKILHLYRVGKIKAFYDETSASSESGFALRVMMLLFGERDSDNLRESLNTLQKLETLKGDSPSRNDDLVGSKVLEILDVTLPEMSRPAKTTPPSSSSSSSSSSSGSKKPIASLQPRMLTTKKGAINLLDDVCFILLDVETTGLDYSTSHVIQLAGKELGSNPEDEFAEYILPPVELPKKIEELTGITDDFLRNGKFKPFNEVFLDFQDFCTQQANGRSVCFVAHNAKFDIGMIESELKRWRTVDKSAPVLADVFEVSLDTLALFRDRRLWTESNVRPSSFKLGEIYRHLFKEDMVNAHNAVGDVRALERLLLSKQLPNWKSIGNKIQKPFIKVI